MLACRRLLPCWTVKDASLVRRCLVTLYFVEAADVLKVLSRNPAAGKVIVDADGLLHLDRVILQGRTERAKASASKVGFCTAHA
ncbi:hypothetical protein WJX84_007614 [Apatococcus fuscideae]|uniref:Uncharacterized protein n=1 Tax=Apatococcus fuscideae TaxID=2026836 RepID=A0AAW1T0M4_9CHLO